MAKKKQTKTTREKSKIKRKRNSIRKQQEKDGAIFLGRPEKFKNAEELRELFNCYLASCQEKVRIKQEIPVDTVEIPEEEQNQKSSEIRENRLIKRYAISEQRKRTKIPTKLGFYLFMGGMSHNTRKSYEIRDDFLPTVGAINNFFERVLESGGLEGNMNAQMVQFVLNTSYGRNPKQVIEETSDIELDESLLSDE